MHEAMLQRQSLTSDEGPGMARPSYCLPNMENCAAVAQVTSTVTAERGDAGPPLSVHVDFMLQTAGFK